jgi:hypothetical protein
VGPSWRLSEQICVLANLFLQRYRTLWILRMGAKIATCERGKIAITREDLKTVVYLKTEHLVDGRSVNVIPLRDGENWRMWIDTGNGLVEGKMIDVVEGDYVGRSAAKPTDLSLSRRCAPSGVDPWITGNSDVRVAVQH